MSTGFAFKQSLHLRSVSNLRIFLVSQPRTFKVGFSGPKTVPGLSGNGPKVIGPLLSLFMINIGQWVATAN